MSDWQGLTTTNVFIVAILQQLQSYSQVQLWYLTLQILEEDIDTQKLSVYLLK